MGDHRRAVGEPDIEHQAVAADAELQRVGSAVVADRTEFVVFDEVVDRDPALVLDVVVGIAEGSFVERDRDQTAGIVLRCAFSRHYRLSRMATERAWASSPSALPSTIAAPPSARNCSGPHLRIEVRFMKSSTPRPEEKRADRAVGST